MAASLRLSILSSYHDLRTVTFYEALIKYGANFGGA